MIEEVEDLLKLVANSIEYGPSGGNITISLRRNDDRLEIAVRDNGEGISSGDQERIFGKFERRAGSHGPKSVAVRPCRCRCAPQFRVIPPFKASARP